MICCMIDCKKKLLLKKCTETKTRKCATLIKISIFRYYLFDKLAKIKLQVDINFTHLTTTIENVMIPLQK